MDIFVLAAAALAFGAVLAAYAIGQRETRFAAWQRGLKELHRYDPPVDVVIEYKNKAGFQSLRHLAIIRALRGRNGHIYVFGICHRSNKPRTFRADRISCFATTDGGVLDKQSFLVERLSLPAEHCGSKRT